MFDADKIIEGTEDVDEGWWIGAVTVRVCDLFRVNSGGVTLASHAVVTHASVIMPSLYTNNTV